MPRYVILEHTGHPGKADHFDLMLEHEGVLKTWTLDRGALSPGPAVEGFDHRLVYLEHEGPVFGDRGRVRRVKGGEFTVETWKKNRLIIVVEEVRIILTTSRPGEGAEWTLAKESNLNPH